MIHHMSFGAREPRHVARILAELTGATAVRAPTPPFPYGAWFVVFGDSHGSFLEILPATTVHDPESPLGIRQRPAPQEAGAAHVLIGAKTSGATILAVATREGWRAHEVETGLFKFIKIWIDGNVLVELLPQDEAARYVATFGAAGLPVLDAKLRALEATLGNAFAQKFPPQVLTAALGQPPTP